MIKRIAGALFRACLVVGLILAPALLLSDGPENASQTVVFIGLLAGLWVFFEYQSDAPVVVDFRFAVPFNRVRFGGVALSVLGFACGLRWPQSDLAESIAVLGRLAEVPVLPAYLLAQVAPEGAALGAIKAGAGFAMTASALMVAVFVLLVKVFGWPLAAGAFNVHRNLPMFDPTSGDDVILRLRRLAGINLVLGFLLPYLVPLLAWGGSSSLSFLSTASPHVLVWGISLWAFVPGWLVMRGLALLRVAGLLADKRRRAYAQRGLEAWQLV